MDEAVKAFAREYYGNAPVARDPQIIGAIRNALSAADAARAVTDEEVVAALRKRDFDIGDTLNILGGLRAAGLKVVRG